MRRSKTTGTKFETIQIIFQSVTILDLHLSLILKKGVAKDSIFFHEQLLAAELTNSFLLDDVSQHRVAVLRPLEVRKKILHEQT